MPLFGPNVRKMREKGDAQGLLNALNNKNSVIRIDAVKALIELGHVEGIREALRNDVPEVGIEATKALMNLSRMDELVSALKNKHPEVRITAIESLNSLKDSKSLAPLIDVLKTDTVEVVQRKAFEALIGFGMKDHDTWVSMGVESLKRESYEIALNCFQKAIEIKPQDKEMIGLVGNALMDCGRYEDALKYFQRVVQIDPADARDWEHTAICLDHLGKDQEVLSCCKKALEIDPQLPRTRGIVSSIYYKLGDYESLASFAQETLQFAPENITALIMLAEALMCSGKLNEAKLELERTLEMLHTKEWMKPEDLSRIHRELGLLYVMKGEKESALAEFQTTFEFSRDKMDGQLREGYEILDVLGLASRGTPQERKSRLMGLVDLRGEGWQSALEQLVGSCPISELDDFGDGIGEVQEAVNAMLKSWSREHFVEFIRIRPRREIEALIENAERALMASGKET